MTFGVTSVRVFGLLLASGILSALIIEMTFTPACRCLLPAPQQREMQRERRARRLDRDPRASRATVVTRRPRSRRSHGLSASWPRSVSACGFIAVDNSFRLWFAPSTQVRRTTSAQREAAGHRDAAHSRRGRRAECVRKTRRCCGPCAISRRTSTRDPTIGGVTSIVDHVKRMHQAMNGGGRRVRRSGQPASSSSSTSSSTSMSAGPDGLSAFVDPRLPLRRDPRSQQDRPGGVLARSPGAARQLRGQALRGPAGAGRDRRRHARRADGAERRRRAREDRQHDPGERRSSSSSARWFCARSSAGSSCSCRSRVPSS